ncbi:MAG: hypothetical protein Q8R48_02960 [Candidatus Omnitrophota bacterium]|nr:hypothetical protein [Candidatus Omnitrophota bacterium]
MKNMIFATLVIICSAIIIISFFMPWAKVKISATQVSKELVTSAKEGPLKGTPFAEKFIKKFEKATSAIGQFGDIEVKTQVSGYDIPTMVNKESSKIAISFVQEFFKDTKDLDKKSMLVFLLPLLGIACMALAIFGLRYKWAVIVILVLAGVISAAGLYNLYTSNFSSTAVEITIEKGIWQTFYAYLAIFIISIAWIISDLKKS